MAWLIAGLGNPGREHAADRHNAGFMVADELARRWELRKPRERFRGRIAQGTLARHDERIGVALVWPATFMNDAGRCVGPARGALRVPVDHVLVIHDEIDLPFGEIRTRLGGGLAGHNGLRSIRRELASAGFWRVRVGVGRPRSTDPEIVAAYVLSPFREPPQEVARVIERAADAVEQVLAGGAQGAGAPPPARGRPDGVPPSPGAGGTEARA